LVPVEPKGGEKEISKVLLFVEFKHGTEGGEVKTKKGEALSLFFKFF